VPRVAIVTGGSSGIGKALCAALVARGDAVVVAARTEADVRRVAGELNARGPGSATPAVLDVRDAAAVRKLVEGVRAQHGRLDLLINNAGVAVAALFEEMTPAYWEQCYDTNVRGVLNGVWAAYPIMAEQGHGQIANTASVAGLVPAPLQTPYTATKHAVVALSISLRLEAQRHGVRVNVICPGLIETPILDKGHPPGLPAPRHEVHDVRRLLTHALRAAPYPADRLAVEVLRDLDRNKAVIVHPASARLMWLLYRLAPRVAEVYGRRYVAWAVKRMKDTARVSTNA